MTHDWRKPAPPADHELKPAFKHIRVKLGQIWASLDKRRPRREMEVIDIGDGYVLFSYERDSKTVLTELRLDVLLYKYTLTKRRDAVRVRGYELVKDVPDAQVTQSAEDLNVGVPGTGAAPAVGGVHQEDGDPQFGNHSCESGEDVAFDESSVQPDDGVFADS